MPYTQYNVKVESISKVAKFKFEQGDYDSLREFLARYWQIELETENSSVDEMWCKFREIVMDGMNRFIPKSNGYRVKNIKNGKKFYCCNQALLTSKASIMESIHGNS